ncbi:MAG: glutamine--fructose-6-phosphate transaminase (isomerizing) [Oscillospiraceae bacterium]|jgi:glucosamine--fructose-6-phosphate aminotransferase (isomerizing)|nr:glutamine--fructose-6-phosphate transaminase (isomerizing) [Oscillospiraceae bacterium]
MCGIIGFVGHSNAVPVLIDGLKRLEYRGYDSAGIAVSSDNGLKVLKRKGRLEMLEHALAENPVSGNTGIGHTRWATHGEPSDVNSHPHLGSDCRVAVVHNGIIENFKALRAWLEEKGVRFASETDSEVIAQLAEHYYNGDVLDTVIKLAERLEGSYALGIMCADRPGELIAVKKDNPLIIGVGEGANYIASDVPAILKYTRNVVYPTDREICVLTADGITFYNTDREQISKTPETVTWNVDSAEKGGYKHFMFKEIMEQPAVMRDTVNSALPGGSAREVIDRIDLSCYNKIVITACGSAYHAGCVGKYVIERLCRIPVEVDLASEFRYKEPIVDSKTLVCVISQSGETADTVAALREARRRGAKTLAIVNVVGSAIAKEADYTLYTLAGPEIAVATTKAFSTQLAMLYLLAVNFAATLGKIDANEETRLIAEIKALPQKIESLFNEIPQIQQYASGCFNSKSIFFIGRNLDYAIAMEGSLKLKEISYIHSEAYAGGELKHGTISLIEENTLVVAVATSERLFAKVESNVEQVISRGARVWFITNLDLNLKSGQVSVINIPKADDLFAPSLSVVLMQLLAYYVASCKGLDIDKPRNLAKSVTVE